MTLGPER